jgi:hypothetical protein
LTAEISSYKPDPGDPLYNWGGTDRKLWLISGANEVPNIAAQIAVYALEKGEPLLNLLSNADHALGILSGDDESVALLFWTRRRPREKGNSSCISVAW